MIVPLFLLAQSHVDLFSPPPFLSRADWGAKPIIEPYMRQTIQRITIHHAGVATNRKRTFVEKLRALQTFSQREDKLANGKTKPHWPDIPYHWYIDWTGQLAECRDPLVKGDTNTEYDPAGHLLICLEGDFSVEEPTGAQIWALNRAVLWLAAKYHVVPENIQTHMDFSKQTDCPGRNLYGEIAKIRLRLTLLRACAPN